MPAPETRFAVLLFTDIVGSTELKARHGVPAYSEALRAHNGHFERIAHEEKNNKTKCLSLYAPFMLRPNQAFMDLTEPGVRPE